MKAVAFTGLRRAELIEQPESTSPLKPNEVTARTVASLISPGTEINGGFDAPHDKPVVWGYAAVAEIDAVGSEVASLQPGQRVFAMGNHASRQRWICQDVHVLPDGLESSQALFARLVGVSWSTLTTTTARPPDRVVVFGLGPVGNLAAQLFNSAGYAVTAIEPSPLRRQIAQRCGIGDVRETAAPKDPGWGQTVALAIDCSGHEQAVLDACRIVRKRGEVVLVGVPWKRRADLQAFEIVHAVFHRYVVLRSGWEWEVPGQPREFSSGSLFANFAAALHWIAQGRIKVDGFYRTVKPAEAQSAYDDLLHQRGEHLSTVFDWT